MNKNTLMMLIAIILILGGGLYFTNQSLQEEKRRRKEAEHGYTSLFDNANAAVKLSPCESSVIIPVLSSNKGSL